MRLEAGDLFWEIELDDRTVTTRRGRVGGRGELATETFATLELARRAHDRAILDRLEEDYRRPEVPRLELPAVANPLLEAAIRDQPDDPGPYLVYADWLQNQGSPLGELIVAMHQLEDGDPRVRLRVGALIDRLGLPLPDRASFGWRFGFWQWLRIHSARDRRSPFATARELFASPLCAVLEELRLGALWRDLYFRVADEVLEEAGRHPWAQHLVRLHVCDDDDLMYGAGAIGGVVSHGFPNLTSLRFRAGDISPGEGRYVFALPRLRELAIESSMLSPGVLRQLLASSLPALEALEIWGGGYLMIDPTPFSGLLRILDVFPHLRSLGLRNTTESDEAVAALLPEPLAARLEVLDLSLGTLTDRGAMQIAHAGPKLSRLIRLDVDDNYLTRTALRALATALPRVCVTSRRQKVPRGELRPSVMGGNREAEPIERVATATA